jgi:hypothetical protein
LNEAAHPPSATTYGFDVSTDLIPPGYRAKRWLIAFISGSTVARNSSLDQRGLMQRCRFAAARTHAHGRALAVVALERIDAARQKTAALLADDIERRRPGPTAWDRAERCWPLG